jgi:hypothetical protein
VLAREKLKWVTPETFFDELSVVLQSVPPLPGEESLYRLMQSVLDEATKDPGIKKTLKESAVAAEADLILPLFQFHHNGRPDASASISGARRERNRAVDLPRHERVKGEERPHRSARMQLSGRSRPV